MAKAHLKNEISGCEVSRLRSVELRRGKQVSGVNRPKAKGARLRAQGKIYNLTSHIPHLQFRNPHSKI
jgi:hypothetical protein